VKSQYRYQPSEYTLKREARNQRQIAIDNSRGKEKPTMTFSLENYVDVPTRLAIALERWPDLRIQETQNDIVTMPDGSCFLRCTVSVWRDPNDQLPAIATAAEPYPGKTPYTKNSEFMVGMTSALGRALGYMGCGVAKSIASRNEIEARQNPDNPSDVIAPRGKVAAGSAAGHPAAPTGNFATDKQIRFIKALAKGKELNDIETLELLHVTLETDDVVLETLTASQASRVIEAWK
jgi:hypothetical protein